MSSFSIDSVARAPLAPPLRSSVGAVCQTLELSESRTYDAALETLGAYKLTGNFPIDLEIVLKDLRVLDKVSFAIKPKTLFSDCRQVEFQPAGRVRMAHFAEIMRAIKNRIGSKAGQSWWIRLFQ
jgi:hypothetical protein